MQSLWRQKINNIAKKLVQINTAKDFYEVIPRMTDMTSESVVSMPSLYQTYLLAEIFRMKGKTSRADFYFKQFEKWLDLLRRKNGNKQILKFSVAKQYIAGVEASDDEVLLERLHGD